MHPKYLPTTTQRVSRTGNLPFSFSTEFTLGWWNISDIFALISDIFDIQHSRLAFYLPPDPPCALLSFARKFPCCVFHFCNFWLLIFVYLYLYLYLLVVFVFYRYKYKLRSTSWHPLCIPVLRAPICQLAPSKETFAVSSLETHGLANTWFG